MIHRPSAMPHLIIIDLRVPFDDPSAMPPDFCSRPYCDRWHSATVDWNPSCHRPLNQRCQREHHGSLRYPHLPRWISGVHAGNTVGGYKVFFLLTFNFTHPKKPRIFELTIVVLSPSNTLIHPSNRVFQQNTAHSRHDPFDNNFQPSFYREKIHSLKLTVCT